MPEIYGAADIGSNTMHLLIASYDHKRLIRLENESVWLSLGEIVGRKGYIPSQEVQALLRAIKKFKELAHKFRLKGLYLFGTEALRKAENHKEVILQVLLETGLKVDLINQKREAELGWYGAQLDSQIDSPCLFFEVGGGSAQIALCIDNQLIESISMPIGTGKMIAHTNLTYPCTETHVKMIHELTNEAIAKSSVYGKVNGIVASGGVSRGLMRALHPDGERKLHEKELEYLCWSASRLDTEQICQRFGVKLKRAKTIVPGSIVVLNIMKQFSQSELIVSNYGVREGAVLEIARGNINPCPI
jgi:exopolyphosphatase/guanosine-5'-triphosphate,3'-diphosphate pyrophosphatase